MFIEDILIYSDHEQIHEEHFILAFEVMRKNKFYVKFSKCDFLLKEVLFLGHITSKDAELVDPSKVAAVMEWSQPENVTAGRSLL